MLIEIIARNMVATKPTMSSEELLLLEPDSIENIKVILSATADETYPHRKKTRRGKKKSYVERMGDNFLASPTTDAENVSCGFHLTSPYSRQCEGGNRNVSNNSPIRRKNKLRPAYSPKAPHNSTQFLMDDNLENQTLSENLFLQEEISIYENDHLKKESSASSPSNFSTSSAGSSPCYVTCSENLSESLSLDEDYSSLEDIDSRINYFEQDFEAIYCKMRAEELSKMSKQELVDSVLKLKSKLEKFECNEIEDDIKSSETSLNSPSLTTLVEENRRLQLENECLKKELTL